MYFKKVLAIETSCDDTSVAIVREDGWVELSLVLNQNAVHQPFAGVVPEIASRNHSYHLVPLIERALKETKQTFADIDGIAVTSRPGLIGSLMVGVVTAKALALAYSKPFIGVNHLEGHIFAPLLTDSEMVEPQKDFKPPFMALTVSGGHTSIYLVNEFGSYTLIGQTIDDAAGEAFDKFAKVVGLGYPGGVLVDKIAKGGDPTAFKFPRPMSGDQDFRMSFSGLKTAGQNAAAALSEKELVKALPDLCASYQEAIVDVLVDRLAQAMKRTGLKRAIVTGGVSANSRLREKVDAWATREKIKVLFPPLRYCSDNAAMIGFAGIQRLNAGVRSNQTLGPKARAPLHEETLQNV